VTTDRDVRERCKQVIVDVSELPDRNSPADEPDMMLVTGDELRTIVMRHFSPDLPLTSAREVTMASPFEDWPEERKERARAIYRDIMGALNRHRAPTDVAFSALGVVLSQVVTEDAATAAKAHELVDEFAKSTHEIIDSRTIPRVSGAGCAPSPNPCS
jgi:uncharacterized protein YejL (UPF0352 family)